MIPNILAGEGTNFCVFSRYLSLLARGLLQKTILQQPLGYISAGRPQGVKGGGTPLALPLTPCGMVLLHGQGFPLHHVVADCMSFATTFFQEITSYSFHRSSSPNAICGARIWRLGADLEVAASVLFTIDKNRQSSKKDCRFFLFTIH